MDEKDLRELDAAIHAKVMGKSVWYEPIITAGERRPCREVLNYSTDIAAAWGVWDHIACASKRLHYVAALEDCDKNYPAKWVAIIDLRKRWAANAQMHDYGKEVYVEAETPMLAICLAALAVTEKDHP